MRPVHLAAANHVPPHGGYLRSAWFNLGHILPLIHHHALQEVNSSSDAGES